MKYREALARPPYCKNKIDMWLPLLFCRSFSIVRRFLLSLFICQVATDKAPSPSA